ncbi:MAG: dTDP-4-dehydrorhamnose 3,5-epimerase family protein [Candidatus Rokubacteria bacterium]|nr:dTDP-4-dehydrorhamnose 3,5-epimerase family protein [Candidatus Rokubacteria bacterium]
MIQGVELIGLKAHVDDRGYLVEILRKADPHFQQFGQVYLVGDLIKGTIKAWHKHRQMWEWFFVSHGSAKFALYDDREDSPTHKEINTFVLGERNQGLLVVPPGVYHGHMALTDDVQLVAVSSEVYNREHPDEVRAPYDSFGYQWDVRWR